MVDIPITRLTVSLLDLEPKPRQKIGWFVFWPILRIVEDKSKVPNMQLAANLDTALYFERTGFVHVPRAGVFEVYPGCWGTIYDYERQAEGTVDIAVTIYLPNVPGEPDQSAFCELMAQSGWASLQNDVHIGH